jgi:molybdopterin molybdotransferase
MISADQALAQVLESVGRLGIERIPLRAAAGRILAEEIRSNRDIPGFDNSAMDGFAVRAADVSGASERTSRRLKVIETVAAGSMPTVAVSEGEAVRIMTGAPVPQGADSIVPVERTRSSGKVVEILAEPAQGEFVRPSGEDLRVGELVMAPGKRLTPSDIGMLGSLNHAMVDVWRRPRVSIVSTGDELVDIDQVPSGAQVVNSSAYALAAAVEECGGEAVILKVARDTPEETRARLAEGAAMDAMLSTGGVSAGDFDHVKAILDELGMRTLFHGVAQKPGRPLKYGLIGNRPIFGLPGNPVSTMVCFYLYVRPALLKMGGHPALGLPRVTARCGADIKIANNLTEFVRVKLERRGDEFHAIPAGSQGSNILSGLSRADGLLVGPARENLLKTGFQATVLLLSPVTAEVEAGFEEFHRFH